MFRKLKKREEWGWMLLTIYEFRKNRLRKGCTFLVVENQIKYTRVIRNGVRHLQYCYIFSVACSVSLEMAPFWSHLFNSHEPYPNLNVQNKPFPSSGSPFFLFFFYFREDGGKLFYKVGAKPSGWVLVGWAQSLMCFCFYNAADKREALNDEILLRWRRKTNRGNGSLRPICDQM